MSSEQPSLEAFIGRAKSRAAQVDDTQMTVATRVTLHALGAVLGGDSSVLAGVPAPVRTLLAGPIASRPPTPESIYERVALATDVRTHVALEMVQSVVAELAAALTQVGREQLRAALPAAWAALAVDPRPPSLPVESTREPPLAVGTGHTIATGHLGADNTIADAGPPTGQSHSIASSDDPHAGTQLAGAKERRPENLERTLAAGRPGSRRSLADADD